MTQRSPAHQPPRHRTAVTLLAATAGYPVAVWLRPGAVPAVWALLIPVLVAVAASRGAAHGSAPRAGGPRAAAVVAAWAALGIAADSLSRAILHVTVAGTGPLVDPVTLVSGALTAGARSAGHRLSRGMADAASATLAAGDVATSLGVGLVGGGCLTLAAAGLAHLDPGTRGWQSVAVSVSAAGYAAVALRQSQRLRREGLHNGWHRSGRAVQPAVARNWTVGVFLLLGGAAVMVSLWWLPPVEPLRRASQATPRALLGWLRDRMDPQTGRDAGEFLERVDREPLFAAGGDVSQTIVLVTAAVVLLLAVAAFLATARRQGRSRDDVRGVLATLRRWAATLRAVVAAMLRRRAPAGRGSAIRGRTARGPESGRPGNRGWRRPSNPRERVRYDYYRVLDLAGRRGLGRDRSQSPLEYAGVLRAGVPEQAEAVDDLTRLFLLARYSHHRIDAHAAAHTKAASRALRSALRARGD